MAAAEGNMADIDVVNLLALCNGHPGFDGIQTGDQLADHHDDQASVDQQDAGALPGQLEADEMSGQEIDQHHPTQQPAAGEGETPARIRVLADAEENLSELHEEVERDPDKGGAEIGL